MQDVYQLMEQERYGDVRQACRRILQGDPGHVEALYLLGTAYFNEGDMQQAALHLRRALLLAPQEPVLHLRYGLVLERLGEIEQAIDAMKRAIELDKDFAPAHLNIAQLVWRQSSNAEDALSHYDKAIEADPKYALAYAGRGDVLCRINQPHEAKAAYDMALDLDSNLNGVYYKRATVLPPLPHSWEEIEAWRETLCLEIEALESHPPPLRDPFIEIGRTLFYLTYQGLNDRDILVRVANLYAKACPALLFKALHCENWTPGDGKIKLGFVSVNLGRHTIGDLMRALIKALPRDIFHITVFPVGGQKAEDLSALEACADVVIPLPADLPQLRTNIAEKALDILYYPDIGMSPITYFLGFSRLAPVQCVGLGHPDTTGLPNMDYFLSMTDSEHDQSESHYSETLIRMPATFKVPTPPPVNTILTRTDLGLEESGHLYACPQSSFKIHPDFDSMLGGILQRDPEGIIVLLGGRDPIWESQLMARFRRTIGPDTDRIRFLGWLPNDRFVALLRLSDVLLDPPHFGGGKTTLEGLWAGTPVVALPSSFARARVTRAYYHQMGYTECLVDDRDAFVDKAVRLATDQEYAQTVRAAIKKTCGVLFDSNVAVEAHVRFFKDALNRLA